MVDKKEVFEGFAEIHPATVKSQFKDSLINLVDSCKDDITHDSINSIVTYFLSYMATRKIDLEKCKHMRPRKYFNCTFNLPSNHNIYCCEDCGFVYPPEKI